jgi:hypothetical protein
MESNEFDLYVLQDLIFHNKHYEKFINRIKSKDSQLKVEKDQHETCKRLKIYEINHLSEVQKEVEKLKERVARDKEIKRGVRNNLKIVRNNFKIVWSLNLLFLFMLHTQMN